MPSEWKPHWSHERVREDWCRAAVHENGRGVGFYQCHNKHKPGSKWCGVHDPKAEERREAQRKARYEAACRAPDYRIRRQRSNSLTECSDKELLDEVVNREFFELDLAPAYKQARQREESAAKQRSKKKAKR